MISVKQAIQEFRGNLNEFYEQAVDYLDLSSADLDPGDWVSNARFYYEYGRYIVVNVKYRGLPDSDCITMLAEEFNVSEDFIQKKIPDTFVSIIIDDITNSIEEATGKSLVVLGRSGGYWGFDEKDYTRVFDLMPESKTAFYNWGIKFIREHGPFNIDDFEDEILDNIPDMLFDDYITLAEEVRHDLEIINKYVDAADSKFWFENLKDFILQEIEDEL